MSAVINDPLFWELELTLCKNIHGLLSWLSGEEDAYNAGDTGDVGSIPGLEKPLEEEITTHSSILA